MKTSKLAKVASVGLAVSMLSSLAACSGGAGESSETTTIPSQIETSADAEGELGYTYGLNTTFHADQPVTYTMFFSDASWYPMVDTWKTEGIFKEIEDDLGVKMSGRPNLEPWARQGVLLLNAVLTVRAGEPTSHSGIGWQEFTDAVIRCISDHCEGVVFMLWGNYARSKAPLIASSKHFVLQAAHPSPLARGAFFGCRHFSQANAILRSEGKTPVDWVL